MLGGVLGLGEQGVADVPAESLGTGPGRTLERRTVWEPDETRRNHRRAWYRVGWGPAGFTLVQTGSERRTGRGDRRQRRIEPSGHMRANAVRPGRALQVIGPMGPPAWGRARRPACRDSSAVARRRMPSRQRASRTRERGASRVERVRMTPHRSIGEMNFAKSAYGCRFCSTCSAVVRRENLGFAPERPRPARCARSYTFAVRAGLRC